MYNTTKSSYNDFFVVVFVISQYVSQKDIILQYDLFPIWCSPSAKSCVFVGVSFNLTFRWLNNSLSYCTISVQASAGDVSSVVQSDVEEDAACLPAPLSGAVLQYEYHILFSCSFGVPVLYFRVFDLGLCLDVHELHGRKHFLIV